MNAQIISQFKKWCNKAERCRSDFMVRAQKLGLTSDVTDSILVTLEKEGWLDEERYAKAFVHDKSTIAKWPEKRIRLTLKTKGIPAAFVQQAIEEEYVLDEASEIKRWIETKLRTSKHVDAQKRYASIFRFLCGKGFSTERIAEILRAYRVGSDAI
jgi:regulatory protein